MRDWLGKPLLLLVVVVLILGAVSMYWLYSSPAPTGAADRGMQIEYHKRLDRVIREVEHER